MSPLSYLWYFPVVMLHNVSILTVHLLLGCQADVCNPPAVHQPSTSEGRLWKLSVSGKHLFQFHLTFSTFDRKTEGEDETARGNISSQKLSDLMRSKLFGRKSILLIKENMFPVHNTPCFLLAVTDATFCCGLKTTMNLVPLDMKQPPLIKSHSNYPECSVLRYTTGKHKAIC